MMASSYMDFISGLKRLRDPMSERAGFKIYLEYEEPPSK